MLFLIDTCFWLHISKIHSDLNLDLRIILKHLRWGYTPQILQEYHHYRLQDFIPLSEGYQIPFSEQELNNFQEKYPMIKEFDKADQSIIACSKRDQVAVLTDDEGLLMEIQAWGEIGFRLPGFCLWLVKMGLIRKNTAARLFRYWEDQHAFGARDLKSWRQELQNIQ